jgi:hypothetical protein
LQAATFVPAPNFYATVGELYKAIRDAFDHVSIVDVDDQYDPSDEDGGRIRLPNRPPIANTAATPAEAKKLIDQIVFQGEGYPDEGAPDPRAHYVIFKRIRGEYESELVVDPTFDPARNVTPNPLTRRHEGTPETGVTVLDPSIDGGLQFGMLQLFAGAYDLLLGFLGQLFGPLPQPGKPPALRAIETLTFLPFMTEVIAPLAELMTHVPARSGEPCVLGPGFEVTTNDFLIPALPVATALTIERAAALAKLGEEIAVKLEAVKLASPAADLRFIAKSLAILGDELVSRAAHGWPPAQDAWDASYTEAVPSGFTYDFKDHAVLELTFDGVFQCRLATDPDGAAVKRGVTGNGFAIGDEPDLDRVIRFQTDGTSARSHAPPIGVFVRSARLVRRTVAPWAERGEPIEQLLGASVSLVGAPIFEGRNHLVSEDGEPVDPFEIAIMAATGLSLRRRTVGIPVIDMTPLARRGTGRYPTSVSLSRDAMLANLAVLGRCDPPLMFSSPEAYTQARIAALQADYDKLKGTAVEYGRDGAELSFRLRSLDEGLRSALQPDARPIRWTRYFFDAAYRHFVSGESFGDFGPLRDRLALPPPTRTALRWLVDYRFGFFDTDAMSACVRGVLCIPVIEQR